MSNEQGKSKRQLLREKRAREQMRSRYLSIGLITIGVLLVFTLAMGPVIGNLINPPEVVIPSPREHPGADDNSMGDPNAPITITEYSDYQCPYCKRFSDETEPLLVDTYVASGKLRFVYRSFGLYIGPESQAAAEAAYCAGDENKYWEFHDILYANNTGENVGDYTGAKLRAFAETLGLDMDAFNACMDSGKYTDRVTQDGIDARAAGGQGSPFFVITYMVNGELKSRTLHGAMPFSDFQTEIEAALAEMGL